MGTPVAAWKREYEAWTPGKRWRVELEGKEVTILTPR